MKIKTIQSFITSGAAVPMGVVLTLPDDIAREYIRTGLAIGVESIPVSEKAIRPKRNTAVTQPNA